MAIKLQWVVSAYDLRPGDIFRPDLDYEITPERCNVRARKLNTPVEQGFTRNSLSFEVILINRLVQGWTICFRTAILEPRSTERNRHARRLDPDPGRAPDSRGCRFVGRRLLAHWTDRAGLTDRVRDRSGVRPWRLFRPPHHC